VGTGRHRGNPEKSSKEKKMEFVKARTKRKNTALKPVKALLELQKKWKGTEEWRC